MNNNHIDKAWFIHILLICLLSLAHKTDIQAQDSALIDREEIEVFADDFFAKNMEELHVPGAVFVESKGEKVFQKVLNGMSV